MLTKSDHEIFLMFLNGIIRTMTYIQIIICPLEEFEMKYNKFFKESECEKVCNIEQIHQHSKISLS